MDGNPFISRAPRAHQLPNQPQHVPVSQTSAFSTRPEYQPASDPPTSTLVPRPFSQAFLKTAPAVQRAGPAAEMMACKRSPSTASLAEHISEPVKRIKSVRHTGHCLHCSSDYHSWTRCNELCLHCFGHHPRSRCPQIELEVYLPRGGFTILKHDTAGHVKKEKPEPMRKDSAIEVTDGIKMEGQRVTRDGINPERVAMIAMTPELPPPTLAPEALVGRNRTKANRIPLGQSAHNENKIFPAASPKASSPMWDGVDEKTWMALATHIYEVVRGSVDDTKTANNGKDEKWVDQRIRKALDALKPTVLRARKRHHQGMNGL